MFAAEELSFTYPSGRRGLRGVSVSGAPGDRVVVMGPNGSGKSTLLRLVSTELPCGPDSLTVFGQPGDAPSRALRRRIGIVGDTPIHADDLTGLENGLLFAELYGLPRADSASVLGALLTSLGLEDALHVPVREYSYGMKKKLLIAQALAHAPDMLVLDEPALGLDPPSRETLVGMLHERSQRGVCTLAATNEPALAQALATSVVFLHEGELVAQGSPAELLAKVGDATRIEVHISAASGNLTDAGSTITELPPGILSIQQVPGRIIAESGSGPDVLPQLAGAVLDAGLRIERIDLREPDLGDAFTLFTGRAMGTATDTDRTHTDGKDA